MNDRDALESQIRALLTADISSTEFSNRVFGQFHGLFPRLGPTEADRRLIVKSELWKAAQQRLRELEKRDFAKVRRLHVSSEPAVS